jgi:hypothetical protein
MRVFFLLFFLVCGCSQKNETTPIREDQSPAEIRNAQEVRTANFEALVGRGVVEFRWEDEDGKHREQGELDFWKQGSAISLRVSKLGELILWFGGDETTHWLFDMLGEETTLTIDGDDAMFSDISTALVLLGFAPLPPGELQVRNGVVTLQDSVGNQWTATFDPATNRPLEMEVCSGNNYSKALHRTGIQVEIDNTHELYWPETGGLIDFEDTRDSTEVKIAFSFLSTLVEDEPMDRVLDLAYLRTALQPSTTYGPVKDD